MTAPKHRREVELIIEALDDVPDESDGQEAVERLGIDVKSWAAGVRSRIGNAETESRRKRFAEAETEYKKELDALSRRRSEPSRTKAAQQQTLRSLLARVPESAMHAVHFHKFEEATPEELAEMIRSLRHLLGEDDE